MENSTRAQETASMRARTEQEEARVKAAAQAQQADDQMIIADRMIRENPEMAPEEAGAIIRTLPPGTVAGLMAGEDETEVARDRAALRGARLDNERKSRDIQERQGMSALRNHESGVASRMRGSVNRNDSESLAADMRSAVDVYGFDATIVDAYVRELGGNTSGFRNASNDEVDHRAFMPQMRPQAGEWAAALVQEKGSVAAATGYLAALPISPDPAMRARIAAMSDFFLALAKGDIELPDGTTPQGNDDGAAAAAAAQRLQQR